MESVYYVPLITLLCCFISQGDCIKCYICSFSPDDRNNRTDKCTDSNFQHQNVYIDECRLGCESVIQYDPNEEMEQWRRNCLQDGHKVTNVCRHEKTVGYKIVRCTCDRDLCNNSPRSASSWLTLLFSGLALLWHFHPQAE